MQRLGDYPAAIFEAHLLTLDDPALLDPARSAIFASGLNAAAAWTRAVEQVAESYIRLEDEYLRQRSADVESVGQQVLQELSPGRGSEAALLSQPGILLAGELSPADTALLDPELALGICTALGGPTSHSAILARSLGIPAVAGLGEALLQIAGGHAAAGGWRQRAGLARPRSRDPRRIRRSSSSCPPDRRGRPRSQRRSGNHARRAAGRDRRQHRLSEPTPAWQ